MALVFYIAPEARRRRQQAKLEAYQEKWAELGGAKISNAFCNEEATELELSHNQLTTLPLEIGKLKSLRILRLGKNKIPAEEFERIKTTLLLCRISHD